MKKLIIQIPLILTLVLLYSCNHSKDNKSQEKQYKIEEVKVPKPIALDISIELNDSIFTTCDRVKIRVTLTNNQNYIQNLLFDKPSSMNPLGLELIDINGNSMIRNYWSSLSSKLWRKDELIEYYYELKPNESIVREFYITDIAVIRNPDIEGGNNSILKNGTYHLKAILNKNYSNEKIFKIYK